MHQLSMIAVSYIVMKIVIFPPILSSETERALYEVRTRKLKNLISPCASDLQQCASEVLRVLSSPLLRYDYPMRCPL